jgi:hypothetical protein
MPWVLRRGSSGAQRPQRVVLRHGGGLIEAVEEAHVAHERCAVGQRRRPPWAVHQDFHQCVAEAGAAL